MHTQQMNQEIARLHRAESLRMSSRHVAVEQDVAAAPSRTASRLIVRVRTLVRHVSWHPQPSRAH
jgi:hypothetical protein